MTDFTTIDSDELTAMRAKLIAAEGVARAFELALDELDDYNLDFMNEHYNNPSFNAALAAYRALVPEE